MVPLYLVSQKIGKKMNKDKRLKILLVNTLDIQGGAARAVYRLHQALLEKGVNSNMLVQNKSSDDYTVISEKSRIRKVFNKVRPYLDSIPIRFYKKRTQTLFSPSWLPFSNVVKKINKINPDIVHLHWVNNGMLTLEELSKIKVPIIWTLHDMWLFTGGCHYTEGCDKYIDKCYQCKVLSSSINNDLSSFTFKRKLKCLSNLDDLTIVGVSRWLQSSAQSSSILKGMRITYLPNAISTSIFKPMNKKYSQNLWSLPTNKKLVLFGALGATGDPRKGFEELSAAIAKMKTTNVEFVVFGSSRPLNPPDLGCKVHFVGSLADDVSLITLYSAVDVMVVPSRQEAFGQTASEAMSCGTPVVAFGHTGLLDIVDHKQNGYLANAFDINDLANGIEWILNNKDYESLCINAREKVIKEFDNTVVSKKYIKLYDDVLNQRKYYNE